MPATDPGTVPGLLPVLRLAMTDGLVVDAAVRAWMHAVGCSPDDCRCHELDDSYAGDEAMKRALEAAAKAVEPFLAKPAPGQMLREFHRDKAIHGGLMPDEPTADVPPDVRDLRITLLDEEVEELREAMIEGDIVAIADGIADVVFVAVGTAVPYGIDFDAVFAEVHRSNMTKVNDIPKAKLTKGPGYEPPDIAGVLGQRGGKPGGAVSGLLGRDATGRPAMPDSPSPDPLAALLEAMRERCDKAERARWHDYPTALEHLAKTLRSTADVPRLLAAVETALKPHREHEGRCVTCLESCSCVGDGVASLPPDAPFATQNAMAFRSWSECTHGNEPWPCKPWRDITKALFGGTDGN